MPEEYAEKLRRVGIYLIREEQFDTIADMQTWGWTSSSWANVSIDSDHILTLSGNHSLWTTKNFKYGLFSIRLKFGNSDSYVALVNNAGLHSEIYVLPTKIQITSKDDVIHNYDLEPNLSTGTYYTIEIIWTPSFVAVTVDGKEVFKVFMQLDWVMDFFVYNSIGAGSTVVSSIRIYEGYESGNVIFRTQPQIRSWQSYKTTSLSATTTPQTFDFGKFMEFVWLINDGDNDVTINFNKSTYDNITLKAGENRGYKMLIKSIIYNTTVGTSTVRVEALYNR